jgi:hypothetical protein
MKRTELDCVCELYILIWGAGKANEKFKEHKKKKRIKI